LVDRIHLASSTVEAIVAHRACRKALKNDFLPFLDPRSYPAASSTVHPQLGMSSPLTHVRVPERLSTHTFVAPGKSVQCFWAVSDLTCALQALLLPRNSFSWFAVAGVEQRT
jgi:hypothetical protein